MLTGLAKRRLLAVRIQSAKRWARTLALVLLPFTALPSAQAQQAGVMISCCGGLSIPVGWTQAGPFNVTGTLNAGPTYILRIWGYVGPPGHQVRLALSSDPQNVEMHRSVSVSTAGHGSISQQDATYIPYANDTFSLFDSASYACPSPLTGSFLETARSTIQHWWTPSTRAFDINAYAVGTWDQLTGPVQCGPGVQLSYDLDITFTLTQSTSFTISGMQGLASPPGATQTTPHLPTSQTNNTFHFSNPSNGHWYDPPAVPGYVFVCGPGGAFRKIDELPVGIDSDHSFLIQTPCGLYSTAEGTGLDFLAVCGSSVPWFIIAGVDANPDYGGATAFPIKLSFTGSPANFTMTPLDDVVTSVVCPGDGSGAACPCTNSGSTGHGCASSIAPGGALLSANGTASVIYDSARLTVTDVPDTFVLFAQGETSFGGGSGLPFGDGLLCVSGTIVRLGIVAASAGTAQLPAPAGTPLTVLGGIPWGGGVDRVYQAWYRDALPFCTSATFNLSNGIQFGWSP